MSIVPSSTASTIASPDSITSSATPASATVATTGVVITAAAVAVPESYPGRRRWTMRMMVSKRTATLLSIRSSSTSTTAVHP